MDKSRLLASGTVLVIESLPPWWEAKISSSPSAARGASAAPAEEVRAEGLIVSVDTSLSPGAHRGRTALWLLGHRGAPDGLGKLRGGPGVAGLRYGVSGSAGAGAAPVLPW